MKNLVTIFFLFLAYFASAQQFLVISEIMYNPPEAGDDTLEYFEIANLSNADFHLEGYYISNGVVDTFQAGDIIPAHGFFVCAKKVSAFNAFFPLVSARQWRSGSLNNSGETLSISNAAGNIVTSVAFGDSNTGWPADADGGGYSMELCDLTKDLNIAGHWGLSQTGTGLFVDGKEVFGTPGTANTAECGTVVNPNTVVVTDFQFAPAEITIHEGETVTWSFEEGHHNVNGNQNVFPSNPASFRSGDPTPAPYTYSFTFTVPGDYDYHCDPHSALMKGKVHVIPNTPTVSYPVRTIGEVNNVDASGVADSLGKKCEVKGVVYGVNMRAAGISTTIIDGARDGIGLFNSTKTFGYTVTEGDEVTVRGTVDQFNGLTQILVDTIWVNSTNNSLWPARTVNNVDESTESDLVTLEGMTLKDPSQWNKGNTFNVVITNGTTELEMRVVNTTTLSGEDAPTGTFTVTGLGGQFDTSNPYTQGYQLLPRRKEDLTLSGSTNDLISAQVNIFPNPASGQLFLSTRLDVLKVEIVNSTGNVVSVQYDHLNQINTANLAPGAYWLKITTKEGRGVKNFVKQ